MPTRLQELYDTLRVSAGSSRRAAAASDDPLTIQLVQLLFSFGVQCRASDIHIEPTRDGARIRYRIDGMLQEMLRLSPDARDPLIRSIKVRANLATDQVGRSKPQDGRIDFETDGCKLDLRLSSFPTLFGDVLAIRVLDRSASLRELDQLGLPPGVHKDFHALIHAPNGLVLVTGPAGSGKTTTLYAVLNRLRSPSIKIVTLEDPVEYQLEGLDQAQINPQVGVTFASGLRAALRQDASIIFVGEIRDKETAEIAIRAALTGHLVFSTLHTRHSLGAVVRLLDMGIELHLILAALTGSMAQRLVRVVCSACASPDPSAAMLAAKFWEQETGALPPHGTFERLHQGAGCQACNGTGYQGRIGIFELLVLTEAFRRIMADHQPSQLYKAAVAVGKLRTMLVDGLEKAARGVTTIEELLRVTGETEELPA